MPTIGDAPTKRGDTRTKMLASAAEVMRERGAAGVTIDAVLARSAPRGSVYYHFPDGRNQILTEALRYSGDSITALIDDAAGRGARELLAEFVGYWERLLTEGGFTAGCPVVAAAIGCSDGDGPKLSTEAGAILGRWCTALTRAFVNDGFDDADAASLAVMSISALEGAIVLSRSTRNAGPLHQVGEQLEFLIKAKEFVLRNKIPGKPAGSQ